MTNNLKQRRVIIDLAVTLDGFIEGKNGEVDWCIMDPNMGFTDFLNQIDTILYGRTTIYGGSISPKKKTLIQKRKFGNWFIVKRNMFFPEHKMRLIIKPYL